MANRTIFVGDLHGSIDEALELLDKCQATPSDWVIFLGDLVDRGRDSAACVDLAMRLEIRQGKPACVMGNHEERALDYEMLAQRGHLDLDKMNPEHRRTRLQLQPKHFDYLKRLPLYIRVPEHNIVAVHAGCYPGRPIEQQTERHLMHIQSISPPEEKSLWPSRVPEGERHKWPFWSTLWTGPERVVFGHSVLDRPLVTDKVDGIDGGACFGRELWAFIAPDDRIVRVKGRAKQDPKRQRALIPVHGDVSAFS